MSQPPGPYERSYSFTDFSTNNPNAQQPGQKIDQELNNVRTALNDTQNRLGEIQADDGKIRESALRMETLGPAVSPYVTPSALYDINQAGATQVSAVQSAGAVQIGLVDTAGDIVLSNINAVINSTAATQAVNAANAASASASAAAGSASAASTSAGQASGYKSSAQASASSASGSAATATAAANAAVNYQSAAISAVGECQSLVVSAQTAASLAEYWNGLAQAAGSSAGSSASSASGAAVAAAASAGEAASSAGDASVSAGVAGLAADSANAAANNAATSANNAAASAASITPFTGGAITSDLTYALNAAYATFNAGYVATQATDSGAYGVIYNDGVEASDGTSTTKISSAGVTFPNSSVQASAAFVPGSGNLDMGGYDITNANFSSSAGQVSAQNVSLSAGGVLTFGDSTVQTTSAKENANVQDVSSVNGVYVPAFGNTVYAFASCVVDIHLPSHSVYPLPIGTQMIFINKDGSGIGFSSYGTGDGATVYSSGSRLTLNAPYAIATAIKIESNIWVVSGDLTS